MPTRPPNLRKRVTTARKPSNWDRRKTRQQRGYGRDHDAMRALVLNEEPLCRACLAMCPPRYSATQVADHIVPKAEGGTDDRDNYQGLCRPCDVVKTAREAARSRKRNRR